MNNRNLRRYYIEWAWRCRRGGWCREVISDLLARARAIPRTQ